MPPLTGRNGFQSSLLVGTPCTYSTGQVGVARAAPEDGLAADLRRCARCIGEHRRAHDTVAPVAAPRASADRARGAARPVDLARRRSRASAGSRRARAACAGCASGCARLYGVPRHGAARRPARRAGPDRALAVDQRPQPRRRLPAPARALAELGRGPRRAGRGDRGGDPARRLCTCRSRAASSRSCSRLPEDLDLSWMRDAPRRARRATTWSRSPASGARPRPACCCSPTAGATCPSTRTSRASARGSGCCARAPRSTEQHEAMLALTPRGAELELHVNLLRHGRRTCHARAPACPRARCGASARGGWREPGSRSPPAPSSPSSTRTTAR